MLENAPLTYIAAIEIEPIKAVTLEKTINREFPNITIIAIRQALKAARSILIGISSAIKSAASLTILSGVIVLTGIMASEQQRRIYESIIFKILGATPSQILKAYIIEYGIVAFLTSLISSIIGSTISWIVLKYLIKIEFQFSATAIALTIGFASIIIVCSGLLNTWRILNQPTAQYLRQY